MAGIESDLRYPSTCGDRAQPWNGARPSNRDEGRVRVVLLFTFVLLALLSFVPRVASAQEVANDESSSRGERVVTISEVTIVGRVQRPIAAVDVSRIQPKLTLSELKQSFTDRIERAIYRAPF